MQDVAKAKRKLMSMGGEGAGVGYDRAPYESGRWETTEMSDWHPWLGSPDVEINPYRDRIVARIRDVVRNDGWASGAISGIVDGAIGADFRMVSKPDWRGLAMWYGKAFDESWAAEFATTAQALWRDFAYDPGRWCDGARRLTIPQLFAQAFRYKMRDGEALAVSLWLPERMGIGKARYAMSLQNIDPDRLSNPELMMDTISRRGGIEIDQWGAATAYWVRQAHPFDWFMGPKSYKWDRLERETKFGRPIVLHDYDGDRAGTHRPAGGILSPVLARLKMLARYDSVELQAAVINAVFAAFVESPMDPNLMGDAMSTEVGNYQEGRSEFHDKRKIKLNDARVTTLYPGEKLQMVNSTRPNVAFEGFEGAMLRNVAAAIGRSYEEISHDWSKTNYSSARAALLESWRTQRRRQQDFAMGFCSPVYANFLEEAMDRGELPLPNNAPDFIEARQAYSKCRWMGPPKGWVDPVKEAQAAVLRMDAGLSTLEQECAEQGQDWEEVIVQRQRELNEFKRLGIPAPTWANISTIAAPSDVETAAQTAAKPQDQ